MHAFETMHGCGGRGLSDAVARSDPSLLGYRDKTKHPIRQFRSGLKIRNFRDVNISDFEHRAFTESTLLYTVEVQLIEGDLPTMLSDMRTWLDHHRVEPDSFRHFSPAGKVVFGVESKSKACLRARGPSTDAFC